MFYKDSSTLAVAPWQAISEQKYLQKVFPKKFRQTPMESARATFERLMGCVGPTDLINKLLVKE